MAAPVDIAHGDFTASAASETINVATLPANAQLVRCWVEVTETPDDSDGDVTNWSLEFGEDDTPDVDAFLTSHDYIADGAGVVEATFGAAITTAGGVYSVSASTNITCTATIVGDTLDSADIDAGGWIFHYCYIQYPD